VVRGGRGDDVVQVVGSELTGDVIDGGAGVDVLAFLGNVTLGSASFTHTGIEVLDMGAFSLSVQGSNPLDLTSMTLLRPGAIIGDSAVNTILGSQGSDDLNGGGGADVLKGGSGNDVIRGGSGADIVVGGAGNDQLFGGSGSAADRSADRFVFNGLLDAIANVDTITGFEASARDRIVLDPATFSAVVVNGTGALDSGEFRANVGGVATDPNDFVLYDNATGNLYYDPDGSNAAPKVLFAVLVGLTGSLDFSDFTTVLPVGG
jgi:Ca2+-binding RTX toxin-like protein